jgi:hypothetical protein
MKLNVKYVFWNVYFLLFLFGCSNKSDEFFDPSYWSGPYRGITFTDRNGCTLKSDPDDWCIETIEPKENSAVAPIAGPYVFIPAYPNPVDKDDEKITISFFTSAEVKIKITIDDIDYKTVNVLVDSVFKTGMYSIKWDFKDNLKNTVPGGMYRCYMFTDDFKCHGDIWIK